jgi:hypothetical protein
MVTILEVLLKTGLFFHKFTSSRVRDSSVGIASRLRAGRAKSWGSIPGRGNSFSLLYSVETGFGAHLTSYAMSTGDCFRVI